MAEESISCDCDDDLDLEKVQANAFSLKDFKYQIYSLLLLVLAYFILHNSHYHYSNYVSYLLLAASYLFVGFSVLKKAWSLVSKGDFFNEFTLMSIATLGAFYLGDYVEGVFVMLFYSTGEIVQASASRSVRNAIKSLIDLQIRTVTVIRNDEKLAIDPQSVIAGDLIQVLPGEMLAVDGIVLDKDIYLNTSNITGEALTRVFKKDEMALAGMISVEQPFVYQATRTWDQSHIKKIMHLVEDAANKKAKTQRLISRLAKVYTPIVFFLALALVVLPYFIDPSYQFEKWFYRALVFLVISCPCAFLIAIPLSYFGGIGLAAKRGVLFKGGEVIEKLIKLKSMVFDKTGTLTYGKYVIEKLDIDGDVDLVLSYLKELESHSKHPLAIALVNELKNHSSSHEMNNIKEYPGLGIEGWINDELFITGNRSFLLSKGITFEGDDNAPAIHLGFKDKYIGKISFTDQLKSNASTLVQSLRMRGIQQIGLLSGDRQTLANALKNKLELDFAHGELLPEDKVNAFLKIREQYAPAAFVGDGVNDAPVLALADVGIAMGAFGSDSAIESADVVIEDDNLLKIDTAINIASKTQQNVWQNLGFAIVVKVLVLILGAMGYAGLWEAIFADVGVALLVVLNAYRLKNYKVV
jgi:Cd2+/Zn2+-exporting ATPase